MKELRPGRNISKGAGRARGAAAPPASGHGGDLPPADHGAL
jgi:hypothetical protein